MFVPAVMHSHAGSMIYGVQRAFLILGVMTIASSVVFMELKADDGGDISKHDRSADHPHEH
jgi:hypothetical protein